MLTPAQLEATRRYAPPLFVVGQLDRRGAKLRQLNQRAIDYASSAGSTLMEVYPQQIGDLYRIDDSKFEGESVSSGWRWGLSTLGFAAGACIGGPIWALAGGLLGGLQ